MSTVAEHYRQAERLATEAHRHLTNHVGEGRIDPEDVVTENGLVANLIALARVHAALATALPASKEAAWAEESSEA